MQNEQKITFGQRNQLQNRDFVLPRPQNDVLPFWWSIETIYKTLSLRNGFPVPGNFFQKENTKKVTGKVTGNAFPLPGIFLT